LEEEESNVINTSNLSYGSYDFDPGVDDSNPFGGTVKASEGNVEEAKQYKLNQYAWSGLSNAINSEGLTLEKIIAWEQAREPLEPLRLYISAVESGHGYLYDRPSYIGLLNENEASAKVRFEVAKYKGEGKEKINLLQQELGIYQQTRFVREQERSVIYQYLAVAQAPSMSELQKEQQARQEARRENEREAEKEIQRANIPQPCPAPPKKDKRTAAAAR
jgi:hypothetical protein